MNLQELVKNAKEKNPELFERIPDGKAVALVRAVLNDVAEQLGNADEGTVMVAGLGRFVVRQVEVEKDGQKETRKRIVFMPFVPK